MIKQAPKSSHEIRSEIAQDSLNQQALSTLELNSLELDNVFWQFSLKQWRNTKLQQTLLRCQDEQNLRINVLLLCIWLGLEKKPVHEHLDHILKVSEPWHSQVVRPLRQVRKSLPSQSSLAATQLKKQIQGSELQAEQIEQAILYRSCSSLPHYEHTDLNTLDILTRNLSASQLSNSDLLLLIQIILPTHPKSYILQSISAAK